jgi:hypothetical protein
LLTAVGYDRQTAALPRLPLTWLIILNWINQRFFRSFWVRFLFWGISFFGLEKLWGNALDLTRLSALHWIGARGSSFGRNERIHAKKQKEIREIWRWKSVCIADTKTETR